MRKLPCVLVIEDERLLQDVYKLVLLANGYEVHTASNGEEGLMAIKKAQPEVVLLDIFMPVMDGKEFLKNIDTADYPDTTFIVFSNLSDRATETEMRGLGADKFVLKSSMDPQGLVQMVQAALSEKQ